MNPISSFDILPADASVQTITAYERAYRSALRQKWHKWLEGDTERGIPPVPERLKDQMAILFENQQWATALRSEATHTTDVTMPDRFAFPIIRKVYPHLWVNRVASIQALPRMSGGVGKIFYQDFKREDADPQTSLTSADSGYAQSNEGAVPKRIKMLITSDTVTATKDILAATWSTELQEDLMGTLGIDAERELVNNMAAELIREMEQRCIADMVDGATAGNVTWVYTVPDTGNYIAKEWYETLGHAFLDCEMCIVKKRNRKADWILAGYDVYNYIQKMEDFTSYVNDEPGMDTSVQVGVKREGKFKGRWDVFTTPYMTSTQALMGVYPTTMLDTSFVLAPYIPIGAMPLVYASFSGPSEEDAGTYKNTDEWTRNVRTRWAKKVVVGDLLATLEIAASA